MTHHIILVGNDRYETEVERCTSEVDQARRARQAVADGHKVLILDIIDGRPSVDGPYEPEQHPVAHN